MRFGPVRDEEAEQRAKAEEIPESPRSNTLNVSQPSALTATGAELPIKAAGASLVREGTQRSEMGQD